MAYTLVHLSIPVMILGQTLLSKWLPDLAKSKYPNMDALVALATSAAFLIVFMGLITFCLVTTITCQLYFESVAVIHPIFITLGSILKRYQGRTSLKPLKSSCIWRLKRQQSYVKEVKLSEDLVVE